MPIVFAALTAAGLFVLAVGLAPLLPLGPPADAMQERIDAYGVRARRPEALGSEDAPFYDRIVAPAVDRLRRFVVSLTPVALQEQVQRKLDLAGRPYRLTATDFLVVRAALTVFGIVVGLVAGVALSTLAMRLAGGALVGLFAFIVAGIMLDRAVAARRVEIQRALPAALDLLVVAVEAGLSFDQALDRVTGKQHGALAEGLAGVMLEVRLGRSRLEALDAYGRRSGVDELHNFIQAVISSESMGVPLAGVLRVQAGDLRFRRREQARQRGAQATIRMLIPMVVFIFPTIWIILLGPTVISLAEHGI